MLKVTQIFLFMYFYNISIFIEKIGLLTLKFCTEIIPSATKKICCFMLLYTSYLFAVSNPVRTEKMKYMYIRLAIIQHRNAMYLHPLAPCEMVSYSMSVKGKLRSAFVLERSKKRLPFS